MKKQNSKDLLEGEELDQKEVEVKYYSLMPDHLKTYEDFLNMWTDWLQYRSEIKKPVRPTTAKLQLRKLEKYKPKVATAMVEQSINSSWQGIFPLSQYHPLMQIDAGLQDPDSQRGEPLNPVY